MLLASGMSVTALALTELAIGTALRSKADVVASIAAVFLVLLASWLPSPRNTRIATFLLPSLIPQLADERLSIRFGGGFLPPWAALAVLIAYPDAALPVGHHLFQEKKLMIPAKDRRSAPCTAAHGSEHRTRLTACQGAAS
jgi:hypothetical protein